ncbi:MAG: hypothetical protein VB877_11045, partial [Pirellulaceae bacterium]
MASSGHGKYHDQATRRQGAMFIRRIWKLLEEDRRLMVGSILAGLCFTGLGILPPLLVRQMIRRLDGQAVSTSFLTLGLMLAAIYLLRGCVRYLYGLSSHVAAYRTLHQIGRAH